MERHYSMGVNNAVLALGVLCIVYYLFCGFYVRFGQSILWIWLLAGGLLVARYFLVRRGFLDRLPLGVIYSFRALLGVCLAFFLAVEGVLVSSMVRNAPRDLDYLVVLGAHVNGTEPSLSLKMRVERAAEYLRDNPDTVAIVSGGQGEDEEITEASCMARLMREYGIDSSRVLVEDRSTSTAENIRYSYALIDSDRPEATVGLVTNGYHMYRALLIARSNGDHPISGVSAPCTPAMLPHNLTREFIALVIGGLRGDFSVSELFTGR